MEPPPESTLPPLDDHNTVATTTHFPKQSPTNYETETLTNIIPPPVMWVGGKDAEFDDTIDKQPELPNICRPLPLDDEGPTRKTSEVRIILLLYSLCTFLPLVVSVYTTLIMIKYLIYSFSFLQVNPECGGCTCKEFCTCCGVLCVVCVCFGRAICEILSEIDFDD